MTFEEFIQQRSLERVGMGSYEWALIKEAWERGAQAEREACAKICEGWGAWNNTAQDIALEIRMRGEE